MIRKIIKALWIFLAVIVLAIVVIFVSISKGWIGYMPPVEELERKTGCTQLTRICRLVLSMLLLQRKMFVLSNIQELMPRHCFVRL